MTVEKKYAFEFTFGNYDQWDAYIAKIENNTIYKIGSSSVVGLTLTIVSAKLSPKVGLAVGLLSWWLDDYSSRKLDFAKQSRGILDLDSSKNAKDKIFYGALGEILVHVNANERKSTAALYQGDAHIYDYAY